MEADATFAHLIVKATPQMGMPTRMAASVTRKPGSNYDELLVGLYEQQGHLLYLGSVDVDARPKARRTQKNPR
jgi:hypothetical protein